MTRSKNRFKGIVWGVGLALWIGSAGADCEIEQVWDHVHALGLKNKTGEELTNAEMEIKGRCGGPRVKSSRCSLKTVISLCLVEANVGEVVAKCRLEGY